jgi:histidyl-tRNA synthetase
MNETLDQVQVVVGKIGCVPHECLFELASWLWGKSITTVLQNTDISMKDQLKYALGRNARYLLCVGEDELKRGSLVMKDLKTKEQQEVLFDENAVVSKLLFD